MHVYTMYIHASIVYVHIIMHVRTWPSAHRTCLSSPQKRLTMSTTWAIQAWWSLSLRSFLHWSDWARVAHLRTLGIMPRTLQARALPDTTELRLRTVMLMGLTGILCLTKLPSIYKTIARGTVPSPTLPTNIDYTMYHVHTMLCNVHTCMYSISTVCTDLQCVCT